MSKISYIAKAVSAFEKNKWQIPGNLYLSLMLTDDMKRAEKLYDSAILELDKSYRFLEASVLCEMKNDKRAKSYRHICRMIKEN